MAMSIYRRLSSDNFQIEVYEVSIRSEQSAIDAYLINMFATKLRKISEY